MGLFDRWKFSARRYMSATDPQADLKFEERLEDLMDLIGSDVQAWTLSETFYGRMLECEAIFEAKRLEKLHHRERTGVTIDQQVAQQTAGTGRVKKMVPAQREATIDSRMKTDEKAITLSNDMAGMNVLATKYALMYLAVTRRMDREGTR